MRPGPMPKGVRVVGAEDLGSRPGAEPSRVPEPMREGRVTDRSERGEGRGRFRLTVRPDRTNLRLVVHADGTALSSSRILRGPPH